MKRYELYFFDENLTNPVWLYWKRYKTERGAFDAANDLLRGLFSDCKRAKIRDASTGAESIFAIPYRQAQPPRARRNA